MRKLMKILFFLLFIQNIGYSQSIIFSKDSLTIDGEGFYEDIKDSFFIKNSGIIDLVIDSIYTNKIYSYPVEVVTKDTSYRFHIIFDQQPSPLSISPQDSIKLIFYMPDLCPICYGSSTSYFQDTLYFRSNALNTPNYLIYISGQGITEVKDNYKLPDKYFLKQNYPNPFNPSTIIEYKIPESNFVEIKIYDVLGKEILTLLNEYKSEGIYKVQFYTDDLPSGVYIYRMKAGNFSETKKMILMR